MATFIAMLELTRLKRLKIYQDESFGEIYCEQLDDPRAQRLAAQDAAESE